MLDTKTYHTHMLLRNSSKRKVKRRLKAYTKLYNENKITSNKLEQMLNSWKGHADYSNSYNFYNKLVDKFEYLELENNQFIVKEV
jgi:RNA-directed DNA polymerase